MYPINFKILKSHIKLPQNCSHTIIEKNIGTPKKEAFFLGQSEC